MTLHEDDDDLGHEAELEYQPHRVDDPDVWGLRDLARGRTTMYPVTIYRISGDNSSGVVGVLYPDGKFVGKRSTREGNGFLVGTLHDVKPSPFEPTRQLYTGWDGAIPEVPFLDEEGNERQGRSKGLLLGSYDTKGASAQERKRGARRKSTSRRDTIGGTAFPHTVAA